MRSCVAGVDKAANVGTATLSEAVTAVVVVAVPTSYVAVAARGTTTVHTAVASVTAVIRGAMWPTSGVVVAVTCTGPSVESAMAVDVDHVMAARRSVP